MHPTNGEPLTPQPPRIHEVTTASKMAAMKQTQTCNVDLCEVAIVVVGRVPVVVSTHHHVIGAGRAQTHEAKAFQFLVSSNN